MRLGRDETQQGRHSIASHLHAPFQLLPGGFPQCGAITIAQRLQLRVDFTSDATSANRQDEQTGEGQQRRQQQQGQKFGLRLTDLTEKEGGDQQQNLVDHQVEPGVTQPAVQRFHIRPAHSSDQVIQVPGQRLQGAAIVALWQAGRPDQLVLNDGRQQFQFTRGVGHQVLQVLHVLTFESRRCTGGDRGEFCQRVIQVGRVKLAVDIAASAAARQTAQSDQFQQTAAQQIRRPAHAEEPADPGVYPGPCHVQMFVDLANDALDGRFLIPPLRQQLLLDVGSDAFAARRNFLIAAQGGFGPAQHVARDLQGCAQFLTQAIPVGQLTIDVVHNALHAAGPPGLFIQRSGAPCFLPQFGGQQPDLRPAFQLDATFRAHEVMDTPRFLFADQIDLVHQHDNPRAEAFQLLQMLKIARRQRLGCRHDQKDDIRAMQKAAGDFLMPTKNGIKAGRVDETDLFQQGRREEHGANAGVGDQRFFLLAMAQNADVIGGGGNADRQQVPATHQGVDDAGLARTERADENNQNGMVGV